MSIALAMDFVHALAFLTSRSLQINLLCYISQIVVLNKKKLSHNMQELTPCLETNTRGQLLTSHKQIYQIFLYSALKPGSQAYDDFIQVNINFVMKVLLCGDSLLCASSIARSKARLVPSRVLLRSLTFLNLTTPPVLLTMPIFRQDNKNVRLR